MRIIGTLFGQDLVVRPVDEYIAIGILYLLGMAALYLYFGALWAKK